MSMSLGMMPPVVHEVKYGDGPPGKDGQNGADGKDAREVSFEIVGTDLIATYSDGEVKVLGRVVGQDGKEGKDGKSIKGEPGKDGKDGLSVKGDPGRGISRTAIEEGCLVVYYTDGAHEIHGRVVGRDGESIKGDPGEPGPPGKSIKGDPGESIKGDPGRGIADVDINDHGEMVVWWTDGASKVLRRVVGRDGADGVSIKGDPGEPGRDGADGKDGAPGNAPRGRLLVGSIGRLTSDRKPPGATNTLNIPDNFARAVALLITDGRGAGAHVTGLLSRGDGAETTRWQLWRRDGDASLDISADTVNGGLAVDAITQGSWQVRMIGSPE